nr:erythromycin esterase family protein [Methylocystis hirsuta]
MTVSIQKQAKVARRRYACLTLAGRARRLWAGGLRGQQKPCEDEAAAQLTGLLSKRLAYMQDDGEAFFDAAQNARIVRAAEEYYRLMYRGSRESWNLRDRHMFTTLQALLLIGGVGRKP